MNNPTNTKVSIIIPVFNAGSYLRQCLDSVINQTLHEIEIICINDGSNDNSPEILEEYATKDKRIKLIHQCNSGTGTARNKGIRAASSPYIGFVDADDIIVSTMYEKMYNAIKSNNVELVHCDSFIFYEFNTLNTAYPDYHDWFSHFAGKHDNKTIQNIDGVLWNKLFIKEILTNNSLYFPEGMCSVEDTCFTWCYFAITNNTLFIDEKLYYYFIRSGTVAASNYEKTIGERQKEYIECGIFFYNFLINNNVFLDYQIAFWQRFAEYIGMFFAIGNEEMNRNYALPVIKDFLADKDISCLVEEKYSMLQLIKNGQPDDDRIDNTTDKNTERTVYLSVLRKICKNILQKAFFVFQRS